MKTFEKGSTYCFVCEMDDDVVDNDETTTSSPSSSSAHKNQEVLYSYSVQTIIETCLRRNLCGNL